MVEISFISLNVFVIKKYKLLLTHFFSFFPDNTFCGDWAGGVYPGGNGACINYVQNNPGILSLFYLDIFLI